MWEQEQGHGSGKQGEDRLDLVKEELEMWEKEVTISEHPDSPSAKSKQQGEEEDGDEGSRAGGGEDSFLSDGRTDGISGDVQVHRVFVDKPGSRSGEDPEPLGFVSLNLNECDGTLLDVRHQVQFLDQAPTSYTFMFDGMPVGKAQEGQLRAAFCDQLILRPDASSAQSTPRSDNASTPPPSRSGKIVHPASDSPKRSTAGPLRAHSDPDRHSVTRSPHEASAGVGSNGVDRARAPGTNTVDLWKSSGPRGQPVSARSEPIASTEPAQPRPWQEHQKQESLPRGARGSGTTGMMREVPQPPGRASPHSPQLQWKQGPTAIPTQKPKLRPFSFSIEKIPDVGAIIPPGRMGRIKRELMEAERIRKSQQMLRAKELMKDPELTVGQKAARERLRNHNAHGTPPIEQRLTQNAVWKPEMRGPLLVIEHDAAEPRYWSVAQELVASMRRAMAYGPGAIESFLPNPRAAADGSTLNDYRSFNRYCFPDGIRFRPRTGSFEVYLVHPPNYQVIYSKLESGSRGYGLICPIASVVDVIKHVLSPAGQKIPRTLFRCREDTGILAALTEVRPGTNDMLNGGVVPEPEPQPRTGLQHSARPSSAPERKIQPVVLTVPLAQSQHEAADSTGSAEDDDDFGAVEEIDSAVEDYGVDDDFEDVDERPMSRLDTVISENDIVDERDAQCVAGRDEAYTDFVEEDVSEAGSMAEELPLTNALDARFGVPRPQSRISSEEAEYDEDFDDEDYNSEEDSDYEPPPGNTTQGSEAEDTTRQEDTQTEEHASKGGDGISETRAAAAGAVETGQATNGAALAPRPPTTTSTSNTAAMGAKKNKPKPKQQQRVAGHAGRQRVASAPPGGRRMASRAAAPRRKRRVRVAKPGRELTEQQRADHLRLMEAAGLLQADQQTPLVLGVYGHGSRSGGQGARGTGGLGFRELRYNDARDLLETAEHRLSDAERIRRASSARKYVDTAAAAGCVDTRSLGPVAAAAYMQSLPQEEYVLVPTRILAAAKGGLTLPLTLDVPVPAADHPQQPRYTGMRSKPGFSRDGWGVSHYPVGGGKGAEMSNRPKPQKRAAGRKKQAESQKLPVAA